MLLFSIYLTFFPSPLLSTFIFSIAVISIYFCVIDSDIVISSFVQLLLFSPWFLFLSTVVISIFYPILCYRHGHALTILALLVLIVLLDHLPLFWKVNVISWLFNLYLLSN